MSSDGVCVPFLLVEDDPLLGATMRRYLGRWSSDVRLAETCAQALAAWAGMPKGVVLMDYRLPDGFGTAVVASMRAKGRADPVICMTGEAETIGEEERLSLGIARVMGKPIKLDELRAELDRLGAGASAPAVAKKAGARERGKYRRIRWRGGLTGRRVADACRAARSEAWVALDVTDAGEAEPAAWRGLCAWAGWLSAEGGRLCLVARNPDCLARMRREVGRYVDVVESLESVEMQASRLTGDAERRQLLELLAASRKAETADGG
jgi:CheY-like chemotaxis protein